MHQYVMDGLVLHTGRYNRMHQYVMEGRVMHTGRHNRMHQYVMNGRVLEERHEERDLDVIVQDMNVSSNCQAAYSKANRLLGMIKLTISYYKSKGIFAPLYKCLVRPLVEYCTLEWSPHCQNDKDLIEKIQHRFTKLFPEVRKLS